MEKENISTLIEPKAGELDATDIKILMPPTSKS